MRARIKNPALSVRGASEAAQSLGASAITAGIPETALCAVPPCASQIDGQG